MTTYTDRQRAAAAFTAGTLHAVEGILRGAGLVDVADRLKAESEQLVTISGVAITPEALDTLIERSAEASGS